VRDGDLIELDVEARQIHLHVSEAELGKRLREWQPAATKFDRGYGALFSQQMTQADEGCDFKFLHGGRTTPEPEIY
jgi:dihydroxy-acid dehydratase